MPFNLDDHEDPASATPEHDNPPAEVINALESYLEQARAGNIQGFTIVYDTGTGFGSEYHGLISPGAMVRMIGALDIHKDQFVRETIRYSALQGGE